MKGMPKQTGGMGSAGWQKAQGREGGLLPGRARLHGASDNATSRADAPICVMGPLWVLLAVWLGSGLRARAGSEGPWPHGNPPEGSRDEGLRSSAGPSPEGAHLQPPNSSRCGQDCPSPRGRSSHLDPASQHELSQGSQSQNQARIWTPETPSVHPPRDHSPFPVKLPSARSLRVCLTLSPRWGWERRG